MSLNMRKQLGLKLKEDANRTITDPSATQGSFTTLSKSINQRKVKKNDITAQKMNVNEINDYEYIEDVPMIGSRESGNLETSQITINGQPNERSFNNEGISLNNKLVSIQHQSSLVNASSSFMIRRTLRNNAASLSRSRATNKEPVSQSNKINLNNQSIEDSLHKSFSFRDTSTNHIASKNLIAQNRALCERPSITGITDGQLIELYEAKCQDLKINPSTQQMKRFFEIIAKTIVGRKLILSDMGIGDLALQVVGKIIRGSQYFTSLDLSKNLITNQGIKHFTKFLMQSRSLVHLNIGCNQISSEGAAFLFTKLQGHHSLTSLCLANKDCYKHKNKFRIGSQGAQALAQLLIRNPLIQIVNLADCALSPEALQFVLQGAALSPHLISLNLSQNDIGSGIQSFSFFLQLFQPSQLNKEFVSATSLEELVLSQNQLSNKNLEDLAQVLRECGKTKLNRLDLSYNKITSHGFCTLIQSLRANQKLKMTKLVLDRCNFEMGNTQDMVNNFFLLVRVLSDYVRTNKSLQYLSLNQCSIGKDLFGAIAKGLFANETIEELYFKGNSIENLEDLVDAFEQNDKLSLRILDLSQNRINNQNGMLLALNIGRAKTLEQLFLKDNNVGIEAGDVFLDSLKLKNNLWKLQLDMNMVKYSTLVDIDRICKKNKRTVHDRYLPSIRQEISNFESKRDPKLCIQQLGKQIKKQNEMIEEGQQHVIYEEQFVHEIIREGDHDLKQFAVQKSKMKAKMEILDSQLAEIDSKLKIKERELNRKVEQESLLVEKCKEFVLRQRETLENQRSRLKEKQAKQKVTEEEIKLKTQLLSIGKEHDMLRIIIDNYEKEIERRTVGQGQTSTSPSKKLFSLSLTENKQSVLGFSDIGKSQQTDDFQSKMAFKAENTGNNQIVSRDANFEVPEKQVSRLKKRNASKKSKKPKKKL